MEEIKGLSAEAILAMLNKKIKSTTTGIKSHSVSGLTLTVVFQDDTEESITFEEPEAADVASAMLDKFTFAVDTEDGHLKLVVEED